MTLDQLRCFCAVIRAGSFREAGERVHRSQPAVSQQVKALERELGHVLLERRTFRLTAAGQRLFERAGRLLAEAEGLTRELADFDEAQVRALRVGTSDTTALYVLPPVVREFSRRMPHTRLEMVNRPSDEIAVQVARGDLDMGIVTLPVGRQELEEHDLLQQRLVLVAPRNHRLGKRRRVALRELSEEPLLLLNEATRTGSLLWGHFRREGFAPQVVLDSGSFEVIKRYVREGVGMSFLPRTAVTRADRSLAVVDVQGLPSVHIGAVWRRGAYRAKAEQAFYKLLRGATGQIDMSRNANYAGRASNANNAST